MQFEDDLRHNIERIESFAIKIVKEFQIMKVPVKVDNHVTSRVDRYKMWAITLH